MRGGQCCLACEGNAVKTEELKHALELLVKVLANPRLGPNQRGQLLKGKRELETVLRSGKLDRQRVFRVIETVAAVLLDSLQDPSAELR